MAELTTGPTDERLGYGVDSIQVPQNQVYLILSEEERSKGFIRPIYTSYTHKVCNTSTSMGLELCETYARNPKFYGSTYCCHCQKHCLVSEFIWDNSNGLVVGD